MKAGLNKPDTCEILFRRAFMYRIHQMPANCAILHRRIYGDRPNTCDRVAFIEKIASDNPAVDFRNNRIKLRISKHPR